MCCTCGWTCGNNDATKDECKAAQCQHVIEVNKAAGAASTEMAEQVAANHGFYICTCGFLGKEVEVTSKAYVVVAITEATAKLQAEVAALKAKNTNLQESLHTATRIAAANTRDLAAAQQENQRLREALVDAVQWLGLLITSHEGAKHLQELRQALLSAPVALPKGESHE
jgi:prefoldin subunit 5